MKKEIVVFQMKGPALDENAPLHIILPGLEEFQTIFDKTYLVLSGNKKIYKRDRANYRLLTKSFKKGSFIAEIEIFVAVASQISWPFVYEVTPENIWNITKETYRFLKTILSLQKRGKPTKVVTDSKNGITIVNTGDGDINFNGPVINTAKLSLPSYQKLSNMAKDPDINKIGIGNISKPEMTFDRNDYEIFNTSANIEENTFEIDCEIFDFNKHTNSGKLSVYPSQSIPHGEYPFTVQGKQDNIAYIESMIKNKVKLLCLKEILPFIADAENIIKLHVIRIVKH